MLLIVVYIMANVCIDVSKSQYIYFRSFPALYWDKFVKKRVRQKYGDQFEFEALSNTLGMAKSAIAQNDSENGGILAV